MNKVSVTSIIILSLKYLHRWTVQVDWQITFPSEHLLPTITHWLSVKKMAVFIYYSLSLAWDNDVITSQVRKCQ